MSILIKGMEIPTCMTCPCCEEKLYGNLCRITNEIVPFSFYRGDKCPLIEIPPHGDLIDRDSVLEILSDKNAAWDGYVKVKALPIVVESEVKEQ